METAVVVRRFRAGETIVGCREQNSSRLLMWIFSPGAADGIRKSCKVTSSGFLILHAHRFFFFFNPKSDVRLDKENPPKPGLLGAGWTNNFGLTQKNQKQALTQTIRSLCLTDNG